MKKKSRSQERLFARVDSDSRPLRFVRHESVQLSDWSAARSQSEAAAPDPPAPIYGTCETGSKGTWKTFWKMRSELENCDLLKRSSENNLSSNFCRTLKNKWCLLQQEILGWERGRERKIGFNAIIKGCFKRTDGLWNRSFHSRKNSIYQKTNTFVKAEIV